MLELFFEFASPYKTPEKKMYFSVPEDRLATMLVYVS
jgi:hypothetical protein